MTLLEILIVVAIVGILIALSVPTMGQYFRRQDARYHAQKIASALLQARGNAIKEGNNYFVHFDWNGNQGQVRVVDDDDNNWGLNGTELVRMVIWDPSNDPQVTRYGAVGASPVIPTPCVPEDVNFAVCIANGGDIPDPAGATFPPDLGVPAVGFNPRGMPVDLNTPNTWGSGAGSYFITDNNTTVYAVTLLPLGGVRVRAYEAGTQNWI
jgi:type II secretory pathway pseudopilin PulG